jgi:hypothetical protein
MLRISDILQNFKNNYTQPIAYSNFETIPKALLLKIRALQQERIAIHYELCRAEGVELIPFDHFWEQALLDMNLKQSTSLLSPMENPHLGCSLQFEPFCNLVNFQLISI